MNNTPTLAAQVRRILNAKISAIARKEYAKANPVAIMPGKAAKPYSLPVIVDTLIGMLAECADTNTSAERLEQIAALATSGEAQYLATTSK